MNTTHEQTWKLDELARQTGVSARTVRYYVQRGLLPAPVFRGRDTVYSTEHLLRLKAIRRLQERFLPLDAIQQELERCSPDELRTVAAGQDEVGAPTAGPPVRGPLSSPFPLQRPAPAHAGGERWRRWELAPGLELHLSEWAGAEVHRYAEELLNEFARRRAKGGYQ
jgi:DNA-binding transcriptional MerR regulator